MAASANSDKLVMLLSTDWFASYWKAFGLVVSADEQVGVQRSARDAVRDMMRGRDTYWHVDFDDGRVKRTERMFLDGVRKVSSTAASQIADLFVPQEASSKQIATTLWLFGALFDQLSSTDSMASSPRMDRGTLLSILSLWSSSANSEGDTDEIERAALRSNTEWDHYLRSLTPDLPTSLADFASIHLQRPHRFRRFWAHMSWMVSREDRHSLLEWLVSEVVKLADPTFELAIPDWMRADS